MPPKNMISVSRNTHMPSVDDSSCCALSSKWCFSPCTCPTKGAPRSAKLHLLLLTGVVVCRFGRHRRHIEIECGRRSGGLLPLEALGVPWILRRNRTLPPSPGQVNDWDQIAYAEDGGSCG